MTVVHRPAGSSGWPLRLLARHAVGVMALHCLVAVLHAGDAQTWPLPAGWTADPSVRVAIAGTDVPVREFAPRKARASAAVQYRTAHAGIRGPATVSISAGQPIQRWSVHPLDWQLPARVVDGRLEIAIDRPRYLQVLIDDQPPLFIAVDPWQDEPAPTLPAVPADASAQDALQAAIDARAAAGGGAVVLPPGVFGLDRSLLLRDGVTLHLNGGAVLRARAGFAAGPLVQMNGIRNAAVIGRGVLDAAASVVNNGQPRTLNGAVGNPKAVGITGIRIANGENLRIDGITITESNVWTLTTNGTPRSVAIREVKIFNDRTTHWNDGINVCGGERITVERCLIITDDDAACVKAQDPVRDVTYRGLVVASTVASGFKIGMQAMHPVERVLVEDHQVLGGGRGISIDHWYGDGVWSDLTFRRVRVERLRAQQNDYNRSSGYVDTPWRIEIANRYEKPIYGETRGTGVVRHVVFDDVRFAAGAVGKRAPSIRDWGGKGTIADVVLRGMYLAGTPLTALDGLDIDARATGVRIETAPATP